MESISKSDVFQLEEYSRATELGRSRICLHDSDASDQHGMLIHLEKRTQIPIHSHADRDEIYVVLNGRLLLNIFDSEKNLISSREIGSYDSGYEFVIRMKKGVWHSMEVISKDALVFEATTGPFNRDATSFL